MATPWPAVADELIELIVWRGLTSVPQQYDHKRSTSVSSQAATAV
jgi:hypothetical protein